MSSGSERRFTCLRPVIGTLVQERNAKRKKIKPHPKLLFAGEKLLEGKMFILISKEGKGRQECVILS